MLLGILVGMDAQQAAEVIGRNIQLFGDGGYGRNPFFQKVSAFKIIGKNL